MPTYRENARVGKGKTMKKFRVDDHDRQQERKKNSARNEHAYTDNEIDDRPDRYGW